MGEMLISFIPAILVAGVVVLLRFRRRIREASEEAAALQKRVAALEQRNLQLEGARRQAEARNVRFREESPSRPKQVSTPPIFPELRLELMAYSLLLAESQKEVAELRDQLDIMEAEVSRGPTVQKKYIAEFDGIVGRLVCATGCDVSASLGIPPSEVAWCSKLRVQSLNSNLFRQRILSLRGFCTYWVCLYQLPEGCVPLLPEAARLIH